MSWDRIDLDAAAAEIEQRREAWTQRGLDVGELTWRDKDDLVWPRVVVTTRSEVNPDSVGVKITKGDPDQAGTLVLFSGGWADLEYVNYETARSNDDIISEHPGVGDWLTVESFGSLLDRFGDLFI